MVGHASMMVLFQSMLPVRGATWNGKDCPRTIRDFNPCSPCGERPDDLFRLGAVKGISIHAPRAGSDLRSDLPASHQNISIHAPRAGSDLPHTVPPFMQHLFQSMLPVRGATRRIRDRDADVGFQSMLPVRGATAPRRP